MTDGGIEPGTADLISGGVFTISGSKVDEVGNLGPVTTLGQNDMVLDNWGAVETWCDVETKGDRVTPIEIEGDIGELEVGGTVRSTGTDSIGISLGTESLDISALHIGAPAPTARA